MDTPIDGPASPQSASQSVSSTTQTARREFGAKHASDYCRVFLRARLLIATKPVLMGVTDRRAPQLLHCMKYKRFCFCNVVLGDLQEEHDTYSPTYLRMICSMAFGGKRPLITMRDEASMEPVVPISASMNEYTCSVDRLSVLQISPKLISTTRLEPSRTTCGGLIKKRLRSPASSGLFAISKQYMRSSSSSYLYSRSLGIETK